MSNRALTLALAGILMTRVSGSPVACACDNAKEPLDISGQLNGEMVPTSSAPAAARTIDWLTSLGPELLLLVVKTEAAPPTAPLITRERATAAARANERVQELLRGNSNIRLRAEFSDRWGVWLVHFFSDDRPLGFASVSPQGDVLEVGGPAEHNQERRQPREDERGSRPLSFRFPVTARIHVPDAANTGTLVTADTVAREPFRRRLKYQFVLVESGARWTMISHRSAVPEALFPSVEIRATEECLTLAIYNAKPCAVRRETFAAMGDAIADYQRWLERTYDIGRIGRHANKPDWLDKIRQVFTIDLWRPHGEIAQDFADVSAFLDELHSAGAVEGVLLYLCGWSGPYDARYPEYLPAEELGGVKEFRRLIEAAHRYGCRVMIHTCPVAFDPWLPSFDGFKDCALKGHDHPGGYRGWPGGYRSRELDFDSGRRTVGGKTVAFRSPTNCEASVTVGGFGTMPLKVTVRDRSLAVPAGAADPYTLPFTFFFGEGDNHICFSTTPAGLWYRVHSAKQFVHVWTSPFVAMDPSSAKWQDHLVKKTANVVQEFKLDAVHLDAHAIGGSTWDCLPLFERVMEALPGVAFSAEEGLGEVGLAVFGLTQGCWLGEEEMLPRSPVCAELTEPYIRHYWHLVGARSCVPVGAVWNVDAPDQITEGDVRQLRRDLARGKRLGVLPTLRINTRKYGLDPKTRQTLHAAVHTPFGPMLRESAPPENTHRHVLVSRRRQPRVPASQSIPSPASDTSEEPN